MKTFEGHSTKRTTMTRTAALLAGALITLLATIPAHATAAKQPAYATPEEAAAAIVAAAKSNDDKALLAILGPDGKSIVDSGDPVADEASRQRFVTSYEEAHELVKSGDMMVIQTGKDQWPMPIPLQKTDRGWVFDTAAGKNELIARRIGRNELATIQSCLAYVDAQREYYDLNPEKSAPPTYAQHIASSKGKKDGLYWDTKEGEPESPLGAVFATARSQGYDPGHGKPSPYHGYFYRIVTAQGAAATGGAYDYVAHGKMIGGFALVAYPAQWNSTGVMTFIVNQDGTVYEKDLGPNGAKVAAAMKSFDPDSSWTKVSSDEAETPANAS